MLTIILSCTLLQSPQDVIERSNEFFLNGNTTPPTELTLEGSVALENGLKASQRKRIIVGVSYSQKLISGPSTVAVVFNGHEWIQYGDELPKSPDPAQVPILQWSFDFVREFAYKKVVSRATFIPTDTRFPNTYAIKIEDQHGNVYRHFYSRNDYRLVAATIRFRVLNKVDTEYIFRFTGYREYDSYRFYSRLDTQIGKSEVGVDYENVLFKKQTLD